VSGFEPLYTAAEMRAAESAFAGPTIELMERAGRATAEVVTARFAEARRVAVVCGTGANGGDGLVVARLLHEAGRLGAAVLAGAEERFSGDAAENLRRAREAGVPFLERAEAPDIVVDALFGTGFSGTPRRETAAAIETVNELRVPVVAVDVASGVDASTGRVPGPAVSAAVTVTFHGRKVGHAVAPGRFHAGDVVVADIGLEEGETSACRVTRDVLALVPRRGERDNKYSAGYVAVVGGSTGLTGAPLLAAEAAMRAGAGYVRTIVPEPLAPVFAARLVEATATPAPADAEGRLLVAAAETVREAAERADAIVLGPGLGRSGGTRELVRVVLESLELPVVLDGDGLWALTGHHEWVFSRDAPTLLTPHTGELARLLGRDSAWVDANRLDAVGGAADDVGAAVLLKGADTLVAAPGRGILVSDLGNPGLASAGTGDVLAGVAGAFLAKGVDAPLAGAAAAAACGVAAEAAATNVGTAGMVARDVVAALSPVLSRA
jgi:ADP-dependent NAD(P)H-hydrate dehydratase / NAD(P)H-hydrate epimerase